jgi:post-segregation antitoxin (ccd killing protein)
MMRVQIQLDPAQHREVKRRAKRLGISVAEVVRRCIDAQLRSHEPDARDERVRRALAVVGKYADPHGTGNVAQDHDTALAAAYDR